MAYRKMGASHDSSMHTQDMEGEELQATTQELEWEMEKELEEPGLNSFRLECVETHSMGNSSSAGLNPDRETIQVSASPHGRFERLQEDSRYVSNFNKEHKWNAPCIAKHLLTGIGAFILGLLIGLYAQRTEEQPATPGTSTDFLERVIQSITAEKILATKRNLDSLFELSEEDRGKRIAQNWEELGLKNIQVTNYTVLISSPGSSPNTITDVTNKKCFLPSGASCDTRSQSRTDQQFSFAAYSAVGSLEAELVDVQYGSPEDLARIIKETNVSNKIALLKLGPSPLLYTISHLAKMGFGASLLYVDPCDVPEDQTIWQKPFGVTLNPGGDPSTPNYPSIDGSFREDSPNLTPLLVQPISSGLARELLSALDIRHSQPCVPLKMASASGQKIIRVNISSQASYKRVNNVIGFLRGKINPDRYVLVGTHHGSWYEGADSDWSGGAAITSQIIASMTAQARAGWQPDRTTVFCSWGGFVLGNIGSFEWGEENKLVLENRAVAYISLNSPVKAHGSQSTVSPSLVQLASDIHKRQVKTCLHDGGCSGLNISSLQSPVVMDYFASQLAVPTLEFSSSAHPAERTHFLSEAFFPFGSSFAETLDPKFKLHETVAKMTAEAILRLVTDPVLPFYPLDIALNIQNKLKDDPLISPDLLAAAASLRESSGFFQSEIMRPANDPKERDPSHVRMLNDVLRDLEKSFLLPNPSPGLLRNILFSLNRKTLGFAVLHAAQDGSQHDNVNRSLSEVFNSICSVEKLIQSGLQLFENDPDGS